MDELIEMVHPESGGRAQLPDMPFWRNTGWVPAGEFADPPATAEPTEPETDSDKELSVDE